MKEALFYESDKEIICKLCKFNCRISNGKTGRCNVRKNINGKLYALNYGKLIAESIDPIEKKPLYNFFPGTKSYSIAALGCNFTCLNCQNYHISQTEYTESFYESETTSLQVVKNALLSDCKSIAYTYTEPTIFYEFAFDTAKIAFEKGIKNIFISNGYTSNEALTKIAPFLDAANIDLKGFTDDFYYKISGAKLSKVIDTILLYKELGIHLEITTLIIPGFNDDEKTFKDISAFIFKELGKDTPWHVSAFYPTFKLNKISPTPAKKLIKAREIGLNSGLNFVYTGNIRNYNGESTICPNCKKHVIDRIGYEIIKKNISNGKCSFCGNEIAVIES